jgi:hypothetical protein
MEGAKRNEGVGTPAEGAKADTRQNSEGRILRESSRVEDRTTVITSELGPARERRGFERQLLPGVEVGREGWERAHSQSAGTGAESRHGILYAPERVNQELQNRGIEKDLRNMQKDCSAQGVRLFLTTETRAHSGSDALKSITYRVDGRAADGRTARLYEAEITVEDKKNDPRIAVSVSRGGRWDEHR